MTVGKPNADTRPPPPPHNHASREWFKHCTAPLVNTDAVIVEALRTEYPQLHLTVVPSEGNNVIAYAAAGHAGLAPIDKEKDHLEWSYFAPPRTRLSGGRGAVVTRDKFAKYLLDWQGKEFVVYHIAGRDSSATWPYLDQQYILSPSVEATNQLLMESGVWNNELHNEVWVFDSGYWSKSYDMFESVAKASWDDVILDKSKKESIINDVDTFFNSQATYERLKVPWKRGIIYYGPPGNGKTISIKAMMHSLYARKHPVPTLYVKSLASWAGPEYSINQIFDRARREAPCYLVFEDLDSLVTDEVRSYFLNAVDGINKNDGILMVGSTNHLERLDPGIAKRPSRFDRKYFFDNPNEDERVLYMHFWQRKLADNKDIDFPDKICRAAAKITQDFSFAYLQEAMVAALLALARTSDGFSERTCLECMEAHDQPEDGSSCDRKAVHLSRVLYDWIWNVRRIDEDDKDLDSYVLWREIKKQVRTLRHELETEKGSVKK